MKYLLSTLFLISFSLSVSAQAVKFKCDAQAQDYAKELIAEEFAGKRAGRETLCLDQKNFKYIRAIHDPINEVTRAKVYDVNAPTLKILKVEKLDNDLKTYRVNFSVSASPRGKSTPQITHQDSMIFMLDQDESWGCAQVLSSPEALLNRPGCY